MAFVRNAQRIDLDACDRLRQTQRAFDGVASTYDRSNTENPLLCTMRTRTRAALEQFVASGSEVLDLGCGPGTDVVHFAARGFRVLGIDWSTAMVDEANRRIRAAGLTQNACARHLGIEQLERVDSSMPDGFDAAYSSFGPLNCVADLESAARGVSRRLRGGGVFVASVIGRACPWEVALYASRIDLRRALVRFSRRPTPVSLEGRTVWTQYYTPRAFIRVFERAGFRRLMLRSLGLFTPPPYLAAFAQRHRRFVDGLQRLEDFTCEWPGVRAFGDHFLVVMRRS